MSNRAQRRANEAAKRRQVVRGLTGAEKREALVGAKGARRVMQSKLSSVGRCETDVRRSKEELRKLLDELAVSNLEVEDKLDGVIDLFAEAVHAARSGEDSPVSAFKKRVERFEVGEVPAEPEDGLVVDEMTESFARFRDSFVSSRWLGCTEETVDKIAAEEVCARVMLRTDVALAIGTCDRIALECDAARSGGRDVLEAAHATYRRTLGAEQSREIRERLLYSGWNGASEETLEDIVCSNVTGAALDNWVKLARSFGILHESDKSPEAEEGFMRRWDPVYRDTARRRKVNIAVKNACVNVLAGDPNLLLGILDVARLVREKFDGFAHEGEGWRKFRKMLVQVGWKGCTEESVDDAILVEMLSEHRRCVEEKHGPEEWMRRAEEALGRAQEAGGAEGLSRMLAWIRAAIRGQAGEEAAKLDVEEAQAALDKMGVRGKVTQVPGERLTLAAQTVDHALMRVGKDLWEKTYAKGMRDQEAFGIIDADPRLHPELGRFAAKWAVHAFQRMSTSHTYAAYCMAMDASPEVLSPVEESWRAWSIMVPNGMLAFTGADGMMFEFRRVLVAVHDSHAWIGMLDFSGPGSTERYTITDEAQTLAGLLSAGEDGVQPSGHSTEQGVIRGTEHTIQYHRLSDGGSQCSRAVRLGRCLAAGLLLSLQNAEAVKSRDVEERKSKPGRGHREEGEPAHRMVVVGHALTIDCRPAVASYIATGKGTRSGKPGLPAVQWMVRGHYRQQVCGVGRLGRKKTWIKPFWKGKEGAPILTHARRIVGGEESGLPTKPGFLEDGGRDERGE